MSRLHFTALSLVAQMAALHAPDDSSAIARDALFIIIIRICQVQERTKTSEMLL